MLQAPAGFTTVSCVIGWFIFGESLENITQDYEFNHAAASQQ